LNTIAATVRSTSQDGVMDPAIARLILVKHAWPTVDPAQPAAHWRLSERGREGAHGLARALAAHGPQRVVASLEPKATETGRIVADALGLPFETRPDLHEHDRRDVPFLTSAAFDAQVSRFFAEPDRRVFGHESASAALDRFDAAVAATLAEAPNETVVVVAHGTVMSLYLARHAGLDALTTWRRLGLPSYVVLDRGRGTLEALVADLPDVELHDQGDGD
jgi:broad specificity phosphatase PhoE